MEFFQSNVIWLKYKKMVSGKINLFLRNLHNPPLFWFHEDF